MESRQAHFINVPSRNDWNMPEELHRRCGMGAYIDGISLEETGILLYKRKCQYSAIMRDNSRQLVSAHKIFVHFYWFQTPMFSERSHCWVKVTKEWVARNAAVSKLILFYWGMMLAPDLPSTVVGNATRQLLKTLHGYEGYFQTAPKRLSSS